MHTSRYGSVIGFLLLGCSTRDPGGEAVPPGPSATSTDVAPTNSNVAPTAPSTPATVSPITPGPVSPAPLPSNTGASGASGGSGPTGIQPSPTTAPSSTTPDTTVSPDPATSTGPGTGSLPVEPTHPEEPHVPTPRTECPEAPPAASKPPAADRALAVSKDEYKSLIERQTPFEGTRGSLPWHLYTPEQAKSSPSQRFPLLVVLHGGYGREVEDGNILVDVAQYLLGAANGLLTPTHREQYPTYIVFPHCRVGEGCNFGSNEWASVGGANFTPNATPSVSGGTALELVRHVIDTYNIDPSRVYLTGNSMGGGGTWEFVVRNPELFAAALPVSGHTPNSSLFAGIASSKLPIWAFGAERDYTNPYSDTQNAIQQISSQGGCAWLTTYTGAEHDDALWSSPYLEPGLWPWLFAQTNSSYE
jgi:predicted esterase